MQAKPFVLVTLTLALAETYLVEFFDLVMMRRTMLGIKQRSETWAKA